jgi:hypothetical protein
MTILHRSEDGRASFVRMSLERFEADSMDRMMLIVASVLKKH